MSLHHTASARSAPASPLPARPAAAGAGMHRAACASPDSATRRPAFLNLVNHPELAAAYGPRHAAAVADQLLERVQRLVGGAAHAAAVAEGCVLLWPEAGAGGATALERVLTGAGRQPLLAGGTPCLPVLRADWLPLEGHGPADLDADDLAYVRYLAAPPATADGPWPAAPARYRADMAAAAEFHAALGAGELTLEFQPVVPLQQPGPALYQRGAACRVPQAEGLHALPCDAFMPALERLGLTRLLDRTLVLLALARLERRPHQQLSCRISPLSAVDDAYWASVLDALARRPAVAARFTLEIGGRAGLPSLDGARRLCAALRLRGVRVAVSRVGSGGGSDGIGLAGLQACRPDVLVLDESCMLRARHNATGHEELQALPSTCAALAARAVVTGVETAADLALARAAGARWACGRAAEAVLGPAEPTMPTSAGPSTFAVLSADPAHAPRRH
ncbi:EAL domain-containing protein [uncultured Pseudacidovorax sp.]|uniref:EAL domain-containing protein n=1 Tax=uncultured Pseudacidovorax sp. TaxID=679313 RepID=UPI0025CBDFE9|nr:EAL domain-containing protein [uncultured Pseudacidovorax sp.]